MNFLFVDRLLKIIPGKDTLGLKHICASDPYLTKNHQNRIVITPCILGEALGQLCSWNVIKSSDFQLRLIGGVVGEVTLHNDAYFGETVILESTIDSLDLANQVIHFQGKASVGNKTILEVKNGLGPLLPIADFNLVEKVKNEFKYLYHPGEIPVIKEGQSIEPAITINLEHLRYDRIIAWEKGHKVIAQKNVSISAPYTADHFPVRPVMPLSLLIESKLQLAHSFLHEIIGDKLIQPIAVRRIKMHDFVEPGSILITTMELKSHTPSNAILTFRTEMEGRRVCICEAEFKVTP